MPIVDPFKTSASNGGIVDPFKNATPLPPIVVDEEKKEPDDHGLARRKAMSQAELAVSPITEYPRNYEEMRREAQEQFGRGLGQLAEGWRTGTGIEPGSLAGLGTFAKGAANVGLGALGYVGSPISAAYRSVLGQPLEDVTGIPREYSEFAAQLATPGIGLPGAVKEAPISGVLTTRPPAIDVPRGVTSEYAPVRAGSIALSKFPVVGAPLEKAGMAVPKQIGEKIEQIAGTYSPKLPENIVGGGIERSLSQAAEREAATAQTAAEADLAVRRRTWEQENQAREQAITARQAEATNAAERTFGNVEPMEMAQDTINDVQSAHRQARTRSRDAYGEVNNLDARIQSSGFSNLRQRGEQALIDEGIDIDSPGSNASKMLQELDRLSGRPGEPPANVPPRLMQALEKEYGSGNVPPSVLEGLGFPGGTDAVPPDFRMLGAHAPAPGADTVPVQALEHLTQRIGRMGMDAETPSDRMASAIVKRAVDDWRNDVLTTHLTPDSAPNARPVIDAARAAHRDLMERFGYNYRRLPEGEPRNAAKMLNQIVTGGVGPEALRDNLIGAKPGNRPISAPLFEAIGNAVPDAGAFRDRLRGAYWNRVGEGSPASIARNIEGLTPTRMGGHLFEPQEHELMRGYSRLSQETPAQLKEAARVARENEPTLVAPEPGRAQELAGRMLGRNRSEEAVFGTMDTALRGGDIKNAARTWGRMSEGNRNEFRGAWLHNMGGGGDTFSLNKFVTNWESYSDQAKSILLGREHRANLQEFYESAKQYKDVLQKYGNPSGTAPMATWHKIAAEVIKTGAGVAAGGLALFHPVPIIAAGLGMRKLANILATPSGAQQVSRWTRLAKAFSTTPTARTGYLLHSATKALNDQK